MIVLKRGCRSTSWSVSSCFAIPFFPTAYSTGKSICSSVASRSINRSYISSKTSVILASARSILLTTTIILNPAVSAFLSTKRVWGRGPSEASTSNIAPSTMDSARSTSAPKSACPGVSRIFTLIPSSTTEQFLAEMVMPLSFSRSMESITLSSISLPTLNTPLCLNMASTSVVFPWSTWAIIAIFLILLF